MEIPLVTDDRSAAVFSGPKEQGKGRFSAHFIRVWRWVLLAVLGIDAHRQLDVIRREISAQGYDVDGDHDRVRPEGGAARLWSRLAFFPLALLYTAGAGSMYYVCVVFFPSLKAFNAALHSVLLLDVLLGTFSATVSLLFIYSYYVPPKRGVRDLCMLETLYRKIKKLPRDLAVHTRGHGQQRHSVGPAANMLGLDADLEEELAFQEESSRRVSVSGSPRSDPWRVEMNRVDEATLARERVLAESDRRIARRWVVIEWAVVGLTAGACLIRLVDDYLTIHPLWTEAESAPYAVYQLSSIFFQAGNSIAVGFHALHCVALASILDLLSRRVRGGAVPPVRYMQLTLDFMHELRKHNRSWGNAVVLAGTFYTFEGVVTLFEAIVFGNVDIHLLCVTVLDYLAVLPLLLVPPALVHTYTNKLLYANNVCRLMLTSHAQSVDDLADCQLQSSLDDWPSRTVGSDRAGRPMVRMASYTAGSRRGVLVGDRRAHASAQHEAAGITAPGDDSTMQPPSQSERSRNPSISNSEASTAASERKRVEGLWRDVQAVDSFAVMLQTSRPYARILFIPVTFELIGKAYTLIISGAYLFGRLVRHGL